MIIYKITNSNNNKIYIGQTIRALESRKRDYLDEIKGNRDRYIIRAMRKYGFDAFVFEILYEGDCSSEELTILENKYINEYDACNPEKGYNLKRAAIHGGHAEETKKKIGDAQRGSLNHMYGKTGADNPTSKETIELTTGKIFPSVTDASKYFNVSLHHVAAVCRGERGSTGNRVFRYIVNGKIKKNEQQAQIKSLKLRNSIRDEYKSYL